MSFPKVTHRKFFSGNCGKIVNLNMKESDDKKKLVLYDFDGTLTRGDTMLPFITHCFGKVRALKELMKISPRYAMVKLRKEDVGPVKEKLFASCFGGLSCSEFTLLGEEFGRKSGREFLRPEMIARIREDIAAEGVKVLVISASMREWIAPILKTALDIMPEIICTIPEVDSMGIVTGKFLTPNCRGEEKVKRLRARFPDYSEYHIVAYGDSSGDKEMVEFADEGYYDRSQAMHR